MVTVDHLLGELDLHSTRYQSPLAAVVAEAVEADADGFELQLGLGVLDLSVGSDHHGPLGWKGAGDMDLVVGVVQEYSDCSASKDSNLRRPSSLLRISRP